MKRIFRIIYLYFIYTLLGTLLLQCVLLVYEISDKAKGMPDPALSAAVRLDGQIVYWTAVAAVISSLYFYRLYKKDCRARGNEGEGEKERTLKGYSCFFFAALLGVFSCLFGNYLVEILKIEKLSAEYVYVADTLYSISIWAQLLCVGVCIPVAEEFVFRILGFRRLRDYMRFIPALAVSALLFGLYHGNLVQAVYASFLGSIIAAAYESYDSFLIPITVHVSANVFSIFLTALPEEVTDLSAKSMTVVIILSLAAVVYLLRRMRLVGKSGRRIRW